jgi:hypothetical protein
MAYWMPLADTASHTFTLGVLHIKLTLLHFSRSCLQEAASEQRQEVSSKQQNKTKQAPAALHMCTDFPLLAHFPVWLHAQMRAALTAGLLLVCCSAAYLALLLLFMMCSSQTWASTHAAPGAAPSRVLQQSGPWSLQ